MTNQRSVNLIIKQVPVERILETVGGPPWTLRLLSESSTEEFTCTAQDLFECLTELRRIHLEPQGIKIACNGSRREVYPSDMAREMSGGLKAYAARLGQAARHTDLLDIFDPAPPDADLASVSEQRDFHAKWLQSMG